MILNPIRALRERRRRKEEEEFWQELYARYPYTEWGVYAMARQMRAIGVPFERIKDRVRIEEMAEDTGMSSDEYAEELAMYERKWR